MNKIAVIDIGSNSIRYMEAEQTSSGFCFSDKSVYTTRLASGLISSGMLAEDRMQMSAEVLCSLANRAGSAALPCYCYATSAVRDAANRDVFISRVKAEAGLPIEILSGDDEAHYARIGAGQTDGGLIDIGGGSSQIITRAYRQSFPLGCVRIHDLTKGQSLDRMQSTLSPIFNETYRSLPAFPACAWTAVGGTATTLAALTLHLQSYDAKRIREACLTQNALSELLYSLDAMGDHARQKHPLLTKRHDVICGGGLLLLYFMQRIKIDRLHFSDADGLEGYAMHILQTK